MDIDSLLGNTLEEKAQHSLNMPMTYKPHWPQSTKYLPRSFRNIIWKKKKVTLILFCVGTISICEGKVIQKQAHVSVTFKVPPCERKAKVNFKPFSPKFWPLECPELTSFKTGVSKFQFQRTVFFKRQSFL